MMAKEIHLTKCIDLLAKGQYLAYSCVRGRPTVEGSHIEWEDSIYMAFG